MRFDISLLKKIKKSHFTFGFLFLFYLFSFLTQRWNDSDENGWKKIIVSDGKGYYAYLTHLFIENDMTFRSDEHLYAVPTEDGKYINRFYCGTALLEAPFFFLGYGVAYAFNYELDGYSEPFAFSLVISAIFYTLLGFYFLYIIFRNYFQFSENNSLWIIVLGALGTNIIFYSTILAVFSHAYSFFAISIFIYYLIKTIESQTAKNIFIVSLLLALIVVIRPVNILIILFIPFFFNDLKSFFEFVKNILLTKNILYLLLGGIIPVFIQCWLWYMQTGHWIEWSYKQEGFYFSHPEFFRSLFSFRRGLFIYCPLLFVSLFGIYFMWKESRWKSIWTLIFLLAFTYVISAWWHWTYGDTFGMRPFNDILPVFFILLAYLISNLNNFKKIILTICLLATSLNLVYAYQYTHQIIRYSNMDSKKFFKVFLKLSDDYKNIFGGVNDIPPYAPNGFESIKYYENNFDDQPNGILTVNGTEFPGGTEFTYPKEKHFIRHLWVEVSFKRKISSSDGMKDVLFVIHTFAPNSDSTKIYYTARTKEYPEEKTNEWEEVYLRIWLPNSLDGEDFAKAYIWNAGKENFEIDDYKINIQVPKW